MVTGWIVSVLLHIGVIGALADWEALAGTSQLLAATPPEERIRLGIESSEASTITWIGFEEPTPHEAEQGTIDQAEFAIGDVPTGGGASRSETVSPTDDGAIQRAMEEQLASLMDTLLQTAPTEDPALAVGDATSPLATPREASEPIEAAPETSENAAGGGKTSGEQSVDGEGETEPNEGETDVTPGNSDRESPARSTTKPVRVEPGKPAAAEGLEVKTVRPRWTHYTRLTARPQNPIIVVRFDATGKVKTAEFKRATGAKDVDQPLLDAVFQWKATGAALQDLKGSDETLELEFEIILRG